MIPTLAVITLIILAYAAQTTSARTVEQRISWLEHRQAVHRYICRHGAHATKRFHCKALRWTTRELYEAKEEKRRRDYTVPAWPWLAIAHCENRTGPRLDQVNWTAYNGTYEGAYGFLHSTWRQFRLPWMPARADWATPREQTIVAMRLRDTFGGYSSWPACHVKLGLPG